MGYGDSDGPRRWPELVILSAEDYTLLRQTRKLVYALIDMPIELIERIAANKMDPRDAGPDASMDD